MSTNAESALQWLDREQPDNEQIQEVIIKLEHRLRSNSSDDDKVQGSKEALQLLKEVLSDRLADEQGIAEEPNAPTPTAPTAPAENVTLDLSPLGEPATIQAEDLSEDQKRQRFEQLKQQLGQ